MGFIRGSFGRITIEARSESFKVHADYGYRPKRSPAHDLQPGDTFRFIGRPTSTTEDPVGSVMCVETLGVDQFGTVGGGVYPRDDTQVIRCDVAGGPLGVEEDPGGGALGEIWIGSPHPEFFLADLDDLIAALTDLREAGR
jgi:hypothetical protein